MRGVLVDSIGRLFRLKKRFTIGRGKANDLPLNDERASRRHARIVFRRGRFWLVDGGSVLGTCVNHRRLAAVPHPLADGDRLAWGDTVMHFQTNPALAQVPGEGETRFFRRRCRLEQFLDRVKVTQGERSVLVWMLEGKLGVEIAIILAVKLSTVNKHLEHIYPKLGVENHMAAVRLLHELRHPVPMLLALGSTFG